MISVMSGCAPLPGFTVINPLVRRLRRALDAIAEDRWVALPEPAADETYSRVTLVDTPELLVIAACWRDGARGDLHGHSESAGLYRIVRGALEEERYLPDDRHFQFERETLRTGAESFSPRGAFHQLRALSGAVSVHAYAPRPDESSSTPTHDELSKLDAARSVALFRG